MHYPNLSILNLTGRTKVWYYIRMKFKSKLKGDETNSSVDKKLRRQYLKCPHCPPNKAENANRHPTHGTKKPRKYERDT